MANSNGTFTRQITHTRPVTPDDNNDLPHGPPRAILVGGEGVVSFTYLNGVEDEVVLAAGMLHPISAVRRVKATGTTATGIKAGY